MNASSKNKHINKQTSKQKPITTFALSLQEVNPVSEVLLWEEVIKLGVSSVVES